MFVTTYQDARAIWRESKVALDRGRLERQFITISVLSLGRSFGEAAVTLVGYELRNAALEGA